jgi:hypothetical protein
MNDNQEKMREHRVSGAVVWLIFFGVGVVVFQFLNPSVKLTYDSLDYLAASESVNTYFTGKNSDHVPYLHRPPLLPACLHFFSDKVTASRWANIFCYATSLLLCFRIGESLRMSKVFLYAVLIVIAFNYPWLQNHFFLWTEPLFTVLALWLTYSLAENKKLSIVIGICVITFFLRKSGLFLGAGAVGWYIFNKNKRSALVLGFVMLFIFALWEYVTFYFSDVSTSLNILSYMNPLGRTPYADALTSWFIPRVIPVLFRLVIIIFFILYLVLFHAPSVASYFKKRPIQLMLILLITYFFCHIAFFGAPDYHEAERYLSVMLPLMMITFFSLWSDAYDNASSSLKRKIILTGLIIWSLYPVTRTISHFLV